MTWVKLIFIVEFFLVLGFFIENLLKKGFTFKGGISFALLYFIFIPIWVLIFSNNIELSIPDFGHYTSIKHVVLTNEIFTSLLLSFYIFIFIIYIYMPNVKTANLKRTPVANPTYSMFVIYIILSLIILIGSGLLEGGNWYSNRNDFFKDQGSKAVLIAFLLNSNKILIISLLLIRAFNKRKTKYNIYAILFSLLDMFLTGNRIYFFITLILLGLNYFRRKPLTISILTPILTPFIVYVAYFGAIFRHIRGPLFEKGFPTIEAFNKALERAKTLDPFEWQSFFLNISESVNVNVIYDIFNRHESLLYGLTYLKTFVFFVPRALWPEKPESITVIAAEFLGGSSLVTTTIGETHMNFGYFGPIFLLPILLFTEYFIKSISNKYLMENDIFLFFFGVLLFRMPFSDEILVFIFLIILAKVCQKIELYVKK